MLFYLIIIQYLASDTFNMNTLLVGVGKREAHINWPMVIPVKAACVTGTTLRTTGRWTLREAHIYWSMVIPAKAAPVTGTTLRFTGSVPADSWQ